MSLIKCPECGKEISDKATICPNCGYPITNTNCTDHDSGTNDTGLLISSIVLCVLGIISAFAINSGIMLLLPSILLILSVILSIKCKKRISLISLLFSGAVLALIITTFIFG